jgi:hypothetical protein
VGRAPSGLADAFQITESQDWSDSLGNDAASPVFDTISSSFFFIGTFSLIEAFLFRHLWQNSILLISRHNSTRELARFLSLRLFV